MIDLCGTCGAYWACDCPRGLRLDAERDDIAALLREVPSRNPDGSLRTLVQLAEAESRPWRRSEAYKQPGPGTRLEPRS